MWIATHKIDDIAVSKVSGIWRCGGVDNKAYAPAIFFKYLVRSDGLGIIEQQVWLSLSLLSSQIYRRIYGNIS